MSIFKTIKIKRYYIAFLLFFSINCFGYYVQYDEKSNVAKITSIRSLSPLYPECGLDTVEGVIIKVIRNNSTYDLLLKLNSGVEMSLQFEMDSSMAELRALSPMLSKKQKIRVEGEVCGSGGIFYPVNIIGLGKVFSVRAWLDELLEKLGFDK